MIPSSNHGIAKSRSRPYREEIDGLRAIAVLVVILFHVGISFPGGFIGVDIFFVISGYLISSIIIREMKQGKFSFSGFWTRRLRRIFPASVCCVSITLLVGIALLLPTDIEKLGWASLAQLGLVANVYFWQTTNYFGDNLEKPLLHTWSLSVEEQFYIFIPIILWILFRFSRKESQHGRLLAVSILITLGSLMLSAWAVHHYQIAAFYLLPSRAWELLCGGLLALLPPPSEKGSKVSLEVLSAIGLGMLLFPCFTYTESTLFPGFAALPPCLGAMLLLWANDTRTLGNRPLVGQILSWQPLRFIGWISYSLYLWHWPVIVYANYWKIEPYSLWGKLFLILITFVLAYVSWKFVETPIRRQKLLADNQRLWVSSAFAAFLLLMVSVSMGVGLATTGERRMVAQRLDNLETTSQGIRFDGQVLIDYDPSAEKIENDEIKTIGLSSEGARLDFAIIGDSHAYRLWAVAHAQAKELGLTGAVLQHSSTPPLLSWPHRDPHGAKDPAEYALAQLEYIRRHNIKHVILHAYWSSYRTHPDDFLECFSNTIEKYQSLGINMTVLMGVPSYPHSLPRSVIRQDYFWGIWPSDAGKTETAHRVENKLMEICREQHPDVTFIDPARRLWNPDTERYAVTHNDVLLYSDGHHLSSKGVDYVWGEDLEKILSAIRIDATP